MTEALALFSGWYIAGACHLVFHVDFTHDDDFTVRERAVFTLKMALLSMAASVGGAFSFGLLCILLRIRRVDE